MRRPFLWPASGLALGILAGRFLFPSLSLVFLAALFLLPLLWFARGKRFFLPLFLLAMTGVGLLRIRQALELPARHIFHFAEKGEWVSLEGRVDSLPELKEKGKRRIHSFGLQTENLVHQRKFYKTTGKVQVFLFNPGETASYGVRVRMWGKLTLPRRPLNPGEFDYRHYLAYQGIHAVFEGYGPRSLRVISEPRWPALSPFLLIQKLRDGCAARLDLLFQSPVSSFLKALILGIRKDLPEEFRDDFIKTSTAHLIAISGMNITVVAGSLFLMAIGIGLPQKGAALVGILATAGYVFLSGMGVPVVRAGWMAGLFFTGILLERQKDLANSLFFAFWIILLFDPLALFQVGFQLSFLCVLSLIVFASGFRLRRVEEWFQTVVVLIGTFPVCIVYFNVFSWISLFANLLAIPLFNLGVLGGLASLMAAEIPVVGPLLKALTAFALKAGMAWIHFCAQKPWGYFYLKPPSWRLILFYYGALALALLAKKFLRRRFSFAFPLALSSCLVAAALFFLPAERGHFSLTLLSAGSSEILHVEFPGAGHWLINTGRAAPSNQARWLLSPFLRKKGVKRLGGILLTDGSPRHAGGLATLVSNFSVESLLFPADPEGAGKWGSLLRSRQARRTKTLPFYPGDQVHFGEKAGIQIVGVAKNQAVLLIHSGEQKFLMLPTWKPEAIRQVLPQLKKISFVDVLILPLSGQPADPVWKELVSLLLPDYVVLPQRKTSLEPVTDFLRAEEIPFLFLSETGALRFEAQNGRFSVSPFLSEKA